MWIAKTRESLTFWTHLACLSLFSNTCFIEYGSNSTQQLVCSFMAYLLLVHETLHVYEQACCLFVVSALFIYYYCHHCSSSAAIYMHLYSICSVLLYRILYCIVSQRTCRCTGGDDGVCINLWATLVRSLVTITTIYYLQHITCMHREDTTMLVTTTTVAFVTRSILPHNVVLYCAVC